MLPPQSSFPDFKNQIELFQWLWDKYPHRCEVTGKTIHSFSPWNFHHILGKGAYKGLKLYPPNILICLPEIHHKIETHIIESEKKDYEFLEELKCSLRRFYYEQRRLKRFD